MFSSQNSQVSSAANYIEDVFSTYLYTGNSTNRSIVNDVDLSGKGGLVWIKDRNFGLNHTLFDTARGATKYLSSDSTNAEDSASNTLTAFNSNGFNLGTNSSYVNGSGYNYASWTFRKAEKFFDVVTYTGNGTSGRTVAHNLGSTPGCIIVKRLDLATQWYVYHRSLGATKFLELAAITAETTGNYAWNDTAPTSTQFTVGNGSSVNTNGATYVAYLFAHDAGGFGLTGTDNVISCGSVTYDSTNGNTINLGYEAQFVILKSATSATQWYMQDIMRGMASGPDSGARLFPNLSNAEDSGFIVGPTATGFNIKPGFFSNGNNIIYIAIRRGPMKVPTSGTSVFAPAAFSSAATRTVTAGFPVDLSFQALRTTSNYNNTTVTDRLRGSAQLITSKTDAESVSAGTWLFDSNTSFIDNFGAAVYWLMRRAPSFFDEVCYTGTGTNGQTYNHNLGVAPELMIIKRRNVARDWITYSATLGAGNYLSLNGTAASTADSTMFNSTAPTSTVFSVGNASSTNDIGSTYVAYLFATCAGVSKVGSYTGTGATQTISCGFAGGARFVLIKRTDISGNWWAWDTARGMVAGTDPRKVLNATDADVNANWVYTATGGFQLVTSNAEVNASGGTYIFLAIA